MYDAVMAYAANNTSVPYYVISHVQNISENVRFFAGEVFDDPDSFMPQD